METTALVPVFAGPLSHQLCNARDLHAALGVGRDFTTWIKERIEQYGFVDGEDFKLDSPKRGNQSGRGGDRRSRDYHLTLDMAKELAMVENNDRGREVRRYFIRVEQAARVAAPAKALPAAGLDKDTQARINRHAWALAQATFERFRREMTADIENQWHRTAVEAWKPSEYREEFFERLAAHTAICRTFAEGIERDAAKLAVMADLDYATIAKKYYGTKENI